MSTPTAVHNLSALALALASPSAPILVSGPSSSGKSTLIRRAAHLTGNDDLLELHLDDQMDSKTLLGSFVCTDIPGEFVFKEGALTLAVKRGRWVLIEDIDQAPFEIVSALLALMESR